MKHQFVNVIRMDSLGTPAWIISWERSFISEVISIERTV